MNLKELIMQTSFENVWAVYCEKYNVVEKEKDVFEYVYRVLERKEPRQKEENLTLVIQTKQNGEQVLHESKSASLKDENGSYFDFSLTDWDEVLGYEVTLENYSPSEFIGHVIYELSFYGTEEMMKEKREEFVQRAEEGNPLSGQDLYDAAMKKLEEMIQKGEL